MARRLEKDALQGAFARGPKPELEFLVPPAPAGAPARKRKPKAKAAPAPEPPPAPPPTPAPAPAPALPLWTPAAPAFSRPGLRARLERRWDALLRRLLIGALGACG